MNLEFKSYYEIPFGKETKFLEFSTSFLRVKDRAEDISDKQGLRLNFEDASKNAKANNSLLKSKQFEWKGYHASLIHDPSKNQFWLELTLNQEVNFEF
ncbi:hypothetical protein J2X69_003726 [Algoriphagus sp. 4150]|uniref:hypothetical protein n=1 Tax=Algoriphagus sp. 4150 TaxID=2817756 RepID=UPI00286047C2|nr:hypothetical protein [Algoriphagus sp. 4150]MDR7131365.1 hypothetical protein [Algoriphagus sp. 4150]